MGFSVNVHLFIVIKELKNNGKLWLKQQIVLCQNFLPCKMMRIMEKNQASMAMIVSGEQNAYCDFDEFRISVLCYDHNQ